MERYNYLYTPMRLDGRVGQTDEHTEELEEFLAELGTQDVAGVLGAVKTKLGGIVMQHDDGELPRAVRPVAVRYMPMEPNKVKGLPLMQGFQAMCFSGMLCVPGREEVPYQHAVLLDRDEMQENWLDALFGMQITRWQAVADYLRSGEGELFDRAANVQSVSPVMDSLLEEPLTKVVAGLYAGRSVIIRPESECLFNERAWELLKQIYSLLHPRMACEVGFSVYESPERIPLLLREGVIRVFIVSPKHQLEDLEGIADLLLDVESGEIKGEEKLMPKPEVLRTVSYWWKMPFEARKPLLGSLFAKTPLFRDGKPFADTTVDFGKDPFHKWSRALPEKGTITSLEGLVALYEKFPICQAVPQMHARFAQVIPALLSGVTLKELAADAFVRGRNGKNAKEQARWKGLFDFAVSMGGTDFDHVAAAAAGDAQTSGAAQAEEQAKLLAEAQAKLDAQTAEYERKRKSEQAEAAAQLEKVRAEAAAQLEKARSDAASQLAAVREEAAAAAAAAAANTDSGAFQAQKDKLEKKIADLERQLAQAEEKAKAAAAAAGTAVAVSGGGDTSAELEAAKKEVRQLTAVIQKRNEERLRQDSLIKELRKELQTRKGKSEESEALSADAAKLREELKAVKAESEKRKQQADNARKEAMDVKGQLTTAQTEAASAKAERDAIRANLEKANQQVADTQKALAAAQKKKKGRFGTWFWTFFFTVLLIFGFTVYAELGYPGWPLEEMPVWPLSLNPEVVEIPDQASKPMAEPDLRFHRLSTDGKWSIDEVQRFMEEMPYVGHMVYGDTLEEAEDYLKEAPEVKHYTPVAVFFPSMELEEVDIFDHIILLQREPGYEPDNEDDKECKKLLKEFGNKDYQLVTVAGDFVLVTKGGSGTMRLSLQLLDRLERPEIEAPYVGLNVMGYKFDIQGFVSELTGNPVWWQSVGQISMDGERIFMECNDGSLPIPPAMMVQVGERNVFIFKTDEDTGLQEYIMSIALDGRYGQIADLFIIAR